MDNYKKSHKKIQSDGERKTQEDKIDDQLDQTFPASDPPSYSKPGNDFERSKKHNK